MTNENQDTSLPPGSSRSNLRRPRRTWPLALLLVLAGVAGGAWWWSQQSQQAPPVAAPLQPAPEIAPAPVVEAAPAAPLPPVEEADSRVRSALQPFQKIASWLDAQDLARRFVSAVLAIAEDESPRQSLGFLELEGRFAVEEKAGRVVVDPRSYRRYDAIATAIDAVDVEVAVGAYRELLPLFEAAYREIGRPGTSFEGTLARAISKLLAPAVPSGEVELVSAKVLYAYADESLEELSPAQKHLVRMGPENMRRVQAKLRALAKALSLAVGQGSGVEHTSALPTR